MSVLDADPEARRSEKTVVVKIAAGLPFRPVEFDELTVTPYVQETGGRPRVAYSFRAAGMRAPGPQRGHASKNQDAA
ncbi:hypothetical protein [Pseudonocardia sp. ICBG1293]|uniref:hypothetical protein n=1 Tax=Pseudonocardia sp. ICBG1293 TaxID=2844382 RepID=UPI001CCF8BD1|nr:hypothetical protein [Pseudonocardia sp. ICBG1293]